MGGEIGNNKESEHQRCDTTMKYCNYCGKKETEDTTFYRVNTDDIKLVFCTENDYLCSRKFFEEKEIADFAPYKELFPKFSNEDIELFLTSCEMNDSILDDDRERKYYIDEINNEGYTIIYSLDGDYSYETIPNDKTVLNYVVKSKHRKDMGYCDQYIEGVFQNGKRVKINLK